VGTQFGLFFTVDGGKEWIKFTNSLPTATFMDIEIQQRENDLVASTFGRGVYILDDYSPLRSFTKEMMEKPITVFPVKDALMYIESNPFGFRGKGFMGAGFFSAPNPEPGAVFTFYLKDELKSLKQKRRDIEKEKQKKGEDIDYPSYDILKKEAEQEDPYLLFVITDEQGNVVRKIKPTAEKGVNRINWDLRYVPFSPVSFTPFDDSYAWNEPDKGYMVMPGVYKVSVQKFEDGKFTEISAPQSFNCVALNNSSIPAMDKAALNVFNKKLAELTRAVGGADEYRNEQVKKLPYLKQAVLDAADVPVGTYEQVLSIQKKLEEINKALNGDGLRGRYEAAVPISLKSRIDLIAGALWSTSSAPTETFKSSFNIAADGFEAILNSLRAVTNDIEQVEKLLEKFKAPYTPGRLPDWKKN
jgi:hypothetical protein